MGLCKTPGSLQINLLFTIYAEQASGRSRCKLCFSPEDTLSLTRRRRSARAPNDWRRALRYVAAVSLDTNRFGGAERDRTADPLLAKQVLSQLSYSPSSSITRRLIQVRQQSAPAIPINSLAIIRKCKWWAREDLNFRPHAYQACALTN